MVSPEFGRQVSILHRPAKTEAALYWGAVGEHLRKNPGMWIELLNCPISYARLSGIGTLLRNRTDLARIPQGIRQPGFQSRIRSKVFWIRYDPPKGG